MDINDALEYINSGHRMFSKPGLSRTEALLGFLGRPHEKLRFVHIAGTNGKGSTAAMTASVLTRAGYRTGLYTSPYVERFNERMQVDGEPISDGELIELTERIRPFADSMEDVPTSFEIITALAMEFFLCRKCDIVVLEVGLGGEFDSTNVISTPEVAVITAIGLDHTQVLGPRIEDVAAAKAGIIKEGGDVVIYGGPPEADTVIEKTCAEKGCRLIRTDHSAVNVTSAGLDGITFDFGDMKGLEIPLVGAYQRHNAAVALTAILTLREKGWKITDEDIKAGLKSVRWPGRFEVLSKDPVFILDGAHNPHGMEAAVSSIREYLHGEKPVVLMGVMADKDIKRMLEILAPAAAAAVAVTPSNPRSLPAVELAHMIWETGVPAEAQPTIELGVKRAIELAGKGPVCALGSLYFSAEVKKAFLSLKR